jgi:hypothetical protein
MCTEHSRRWRGMHPLREGRRALQLRKTDRSVTSPDQNSFSRPNALGFFAGRGGHSPRSELSHFKSAGDDNSDPSLRMLHVVIQTALEYLDDSAIDMLLDGRGR